MNSNQAKKRIADFYNARFELFADFEKNAGYNIWFLETFRLYFSLVNLEENQAKKSNRKPSIFHLIYSEFLILVSEVFRKSEKPARTQFFINRRIIEDSSILPFESIEGMNVQFIMNREITTTKINHINQTLESPSSDGIFLNYILSSAWVYDLWRFRRLFKKLKSAVAKSIINEKEQVLWDRMLKNGTANFLICNFRFHAFRRYFRKSGVTRIILSDENSPQQKVIQYAARANKVDVYAVQHGNIAPSSPAYMYGEYIKKPFLPKKTFLWGSLFKDLLVRDGGYTPESLVITGRIERFQILKEFKIERTILFASQPIKNEGLRLRYIRDVFTAVTTNAKGYRLIVRPHPSERGDAVFKRIADEQGLQNYTVDWKTPLYDQMADCEMLIVAFSTVGSEFIQFNKPMIVLDYLIEDIMGWIEAKVGVQVMNIEQLIDALNSALVIENGPSRDQFVERLFYKNDGRGLLRIMDFLERNQ